MLMAGQKYKGFMIPKAELIHGAYYHGTCRNAHEARWNGDEQQFYHWRCKWGQWFQETIKHPDDDDIYDVFIPDKLVEIPEKVIFFKGEK